MNPLTLLMRLNFTAKDIGHSDLVDEDTGEVKYTIRTNIDGKLKTIRKPTKESTSDRGNVTQGIFVARFHLHTVMPDKIELQEGTEVDVKQWMQTEDKEYVCCTLHRGVRCSRVLIRIVFASQSGQKYSWSPQPHGDAAVSRLQASLCFTTSDTPMSPAAQ